MAINTKAYIEKCLKIKDKKSNIIPLKINAPQMKLYNALKKQYDQGKPMRAIILKARQMGFSTLSEAIIFKRTATAFNVNSAVVSHDIKATNDLLDMFKRFYDELEPGLKPSTVASNRKQVIFDNKLGTGLKSKIDCLTAGNEKIGRGATYNNLHLSEFAWWQGDPAQTLLGLMQAVPHERDSLVIIESTANGFNEFKKLWDAAESGQSEFAPVFCAWWEMPEYRLPYDGFSLTEEEKEMKERFGLDCEQIAWRRWCLANNCGGSVEMFRQEYPASPEEAFIASGACLFDTEKVIGRINECPDGEQMRIKYDFDGDRITNAELVNGESDLIIFEEPKKGHPYVIGADTAGEGSDFNVAQIIDNATGRQVARMRTHEDEGLFARDLFALGTIYNGALIAVECNFSTYPNRELERLGYKRIYVRKKEDLFTRKMIDAFGFRTTAITRPIILSNLVDIVRESVHLINDKDTLKEMLVFCKNERGRAEALAGEHDDCVMALAIAYGCRDQQSFKIESEEEKKSIRWTEDMYDDYAAASDEQRKLLIKRWGNPQ